MSIESVLRCAILKQYWQQSYVALEFNLEDSDMYKAFARLPINFSPKKSTLQENISKLPALAWEYLNRVILQIALDTGVETGQKVRVDTTAIASHILSPTDNHLMVQAVDKILKLLSKTGGVYKSHLRKVKKLSTGIRSCRGKEKRKKLYKELLQYARKTFGYVVNVLSDKNLCIQESTQRSLIELQDKLGRIISQAHRRVVLEETVPVEEKIISLHDEHTDIIRKDNRGTTFGHKVNFVTGVSGMVIAVDMPKGNPADSELFLPAIVQITNVYGKPPRQVAADGGFASQTNLAQAKSIGVKDVAFHKRRGLSVSDMCKSDWVFKQLLKFRAGVEGNISFLKRIFGLDRCDWKGWEGFQKYVMSAVVTYNLVMLSRKQPE